MGNLRSFKPTVHRSDTRRALAGLGFRGKKPKKTRRARLLDELVEHVEAHGSYRCPHCDAEAFVGQDGDTTRVALEHHKGCPILRDPKIHLDA